MSIAWCPACGAEYLATAVQCADCLVPLTAERPESPYSRHEEGEEVVYELEDLDPDEQVRLDLMLRGQVQHRWEPGGQLVVAAADVEKVDALLDEVDFPDALEPVDDDDDGDSDARSYKVMSELYVAADRLKNDPNDDVIAGDFLDAADAASGTPPPYGIDTGLWVKVQSLASSISDAIDSDTPDEVEIARDAADLRDLLFRHV